MDSTCSSSEVTVNPNEVLKQEEKKKSELEVFKKSKVGEPEPVEDVEKVVPPVLQVVNAGPVRIQPSLRGKYLINEYGTGKWEGQWGMDDNAFSGGIVSPFSYSTVPVPDSCHNEANISDAKFKGHFMLGSSIPAHPSTKHEERDILFKFESVSTLPESVLKVIGHGKNHFGYFELDGTYHLETKDLHCYRVYKKKPAKPKKPKTAQKKRPRVQNSMSRAGPIPALEPPLQSRTSRIRRAPSHLVDENRDDGSSKSSALYQIRKLLLNLLKNDKEGWFSVPVNAQALGLPTYHTVIKSPMDLGTIKKRLDENKYSNQAQVADEIRLTFNNACTFNPVGHAVHAVAAQHLKLFESELKKILRNQSNKKKKGKSETSGYKRKSGKKSEINRENPFGSSSDDNDSDSDSGFVRKRKKTTGSRDNPEVVNLRRQVEEMNKQIALITQVQQQSVLMQQSSHVISAPPTAQSKNLRPLSYQQKRQLSQDIRKLPNDSLHGVIQILTECGVTAGVEGEEVELDIETMGPYASRKIQKYVRKCLTKARKLKSKEEINDILLESQLEKDSE